MRCLDCKYDLRNLAEHRCPECGREFDPNDSGTFDYGQARRIWTCVTISAICSLGCYPVLFVLWLIGSFMRNVQKSTMLANGAYMTVVTYEPWPVTASRAAIGAFLTVPILTTCAVVAWIVISGHFHPKSQSRVD